MNAPRSSEADPPPNDLVRQKPPSKSHWIHWLVQHAQWHKSRGTKGTRLCLQNMDLRHMPCENSTLSDALLKDCDLRGVVFKGSAMARIDLRGSLLDGADLRRTDMSRAKLFDARLHNARLGNAILEDALLQKADLLRADLSRTQLKDADLSGACLDHVYAFGADFTGADLSHASFRQANLLKARLGAADLSHAMGEKAYLGGADLRGARLRHTWLQGAKLDDVRLEGSSLQDVNLRDVRGEGLKATGASFNNVQLQGAMLQRANLSETLFSTVTCHEVDLRDANLKRSEWRHTTFHHVALKGAQLSGASIDQETASRSQWSKQQTELWLDRGGAIVADHTSASPDVLDATPPEAPDFFPTGGGAPQLPATQIPDVIACQQAAHGADALPTQLPRAIKPGMRLQGRFQVERLLGVGGMGEVFLCTDLQAQEMCAVKLLHATLSHHPTLLKRFAQEIALSDAMAHPNLVKCADLQRDEETGRVFFTMPYLRGETLGRRLQRVAPRPLPPSTCLQLLDALAETLDYAHGCGVIHRDVKPSNIMILSSGQLKLMDFGIAHRAAGQNTNLHTNGPGTFYYTAPEQLRGEAIITASADIYSLGVLAYHTLTGEVPMGFPLPPSEINGDLPNATDAVLFQAMSPYPQRRYPCCRNFVTSLRAVFARAA